MAFVINSDRFLAAEGHFLRFAVIRTGDRSLEESVIVATSSGAAKCDYDYQRLYEELTFQPDEMQKDLEIFIIADGEPEFTEDFRIQLLQTTNQTNKFAGELGQPNVALVEILDRDTAIPSHPPKTND